MQTELADTKLQIDSLNVQKDSLEKKLEELKIDIVQACPPKKKKWYINSDIATNKKEKILSRWGQ